MTENERPEPKLTPKQEALIVALLSNPTIVAAAQSANVPEATARRWLTQEHFKQAYQTAKQEHFTNALEMLQLGMGDAIKALKKNMTSDKVSGATQVKAAQIWIEQTINLYKMSELERKIAELEEIVQERRQ